MAYTKTKSSTRNYVDVQYTATYQQKLSLLPSVVESMEKMEKKKNLIKFTYTQYTSTVQTWPLCAQPEPQ